MSLFHQTPCSRRRRAKEQADGVRGAEGTALDRSESGEAFWQFYVENFGPAKMLAEPLDDERCERFHRTYLEFFETNYRVDGQIEYPREWLLVTGTRR